jgi:hypothetical protein
MSGLINVSGARSGIVGTTVAADVGGSMVYLAKVEHTGSGTPVLTLDGYFTSTYDHYKYIFSISAVHANTDACIQFRSGGTRIGSLVNGTGTQGGDYRSVGDSAYNADTADPPHNGFGRWDKSYILIGSQDQTNSAEWPVSGEMLLHHPLSTSKKKIVTSMSLSYNSGSPPSAIRNVNMAGILDQATSVVLSGIEFKYDTSNSDTIKGTVSLYGIKNS